MASKNLHADPFNESTIAKLEIFEDYAQAWIPTFVFQKGVQTICIFDFFAGPGYDKNGIAGSPIRILKKISEQLRRILQKNVKVQVYLNEFEPNKFKFLKKACEDFLASNDDLKIAIQINFFNEDFEKLFSKLLPKIKEFPALVYLDQNGIKYLSEKYFLELEKTIKTDFLYFVSSSSFWRFGYKKEFSNHLNIDMEEAKQNPYGFIHRSIVKQLRDKLPNATKLRLYPFSLKKGANIHGIIFGASHPIAVDKFLSIAWKRNELNGEANFDIDDDELKRQPELFGNTRLTKLESFKKKVADRIQAREISNNFQLLEFAFAEGHLGKHAAEVLREMKMSGLVHFEGSSPLVTYEKVYSPRRKLLEYKILK